MVTLQSATSNSGAEFPRATPAAAAKTPDIASASIPDTLAALHVDSETGLTRAEVDTRRKEHGYNEVAVQKGHPVLIFLGKFWGLSAWMLELIMVLSLVLRKYSDFAVVSALLFVNAILSFAQERRAAGVVETLRRRLQVSARAAPRRGSRRGGDDGGAAGGGGGFPAGGPPPPGNCSREISPGGPRATS